MVSRAFPKSKRLSKPAEFSVVYQNNQTRVKGQYFIVLAFSHFDTVANRPADDTITEVLSDARLGAVVSKKVSKLAVRRNRIKRLIRESFRNQTRHPDGFDFVAIAKPQANLANNERLRKELNYLWKKLHQRCDTC